jgi:hypothetical protein
MSTSTIREAGATGPGVASLNTEPPREKDDDVAIGVDRKVAGFYELDIHPPWQKYRISGGWIW